MLGLQDAPELLATLAKREKQLRALNYHPISNCDEVAVYFPC